MKFKFDIKRITDDNYRHKVSLLVVSLTSFVFTLIFTIINLTTANYLLSVVTFILCLTSLINIIYTHNNGDLSKSDEIFYITWTFASLFFIYSGAANGFSVLWVTVIPYSILVLNKENGTIFSLFIFVILVFSFWTPFGRGMLQFDYSREILERFPFLYLANLGLVYTYEIIRGATNDELNRTKEYYRQLMNKDELTQLANRKLFNTKFQTLIDNPLKTESSMMIIDIDDFKKINDTHGHLSGDKILKELADILTNTIPSSTFLCRWGGEEFVILMEFFNQNEAKLLAETIKHRIKTAEFFTVNNEEIQVTVSIGVTSFISGEVDSGKNVFINADKALYTAKKNGKDAIAFIPTD